MPEQRQAFQRELDAIDAEVIELFALVAADLARAARTLPNGSNEVAEVLTEHGLVIDLLCPEIERRVKTAILLQAPVASDPGLRTKSFPLFRRRLQGRTVRGCVPPPRHGRLRPDKGPVPARAGRSEGSC